MRRFSAFPDITSLSLGIGCLALLFWCTAAQANDDGIPSFDETKKTLVKICDSMTAK